MYPKLEIDLKKIKENSQILSKNCRDNQIIPICVTKSFCAYPEVAEVMVSGGMEMMADSRISNLKKLAKINAPKVLLRLPMLSEVDEVVKYADISLNSESVTINALNVAAEKQSKVHKIILMFDLGDLREGILPSDLDAYVSEIVTLKNIELYGIGVNLTCYGGVIPDEINLGQLNTLAQQIQKDYNIDLKIISGGNSSSYYLLEEKRMPKGINNLRLGEILVLGRETAYGNLIEGLHTDAFTLKAEIIELKVKDSIPTGTIGMDAFGSKPVFEDKGKMKRAIASIGRQDVNPLGLTPYDEKMELVGASSDHMILDVTNSEKDYKVGDVISFNVDYGALLMLTTSEYVEKEFI